MRSIKFPDMFNSNSTNVWLSDEYNKATSQNARLLLETNRGEMFGDPYFGLAIKQYMFDQNDYVLKDIIIDMIYTQVALFIPQIHIERRDISIAQTRGKLTCVIKGINQIDYKPNTYQLTLYDSSEPMA